MKIWQILLLSVMTSTLMEIVIGVYAPDSVGIAFVSWMIISAVSFKLIQGGKNVQ